MQYGICATLDFAATAAAAGCEFLEMTTGDALRPAGTEAEFLAALAQFREAALPCKALNCFLPGHLKIVGPDADPRAARGYVTIVCRRAQQAGVETIVFGSSTSRRVPEGFDRGEAHRQLVSFCRMLGPVAAHHGITIAVEPLCRKECNVLNTVAEAAALVRETGHPAIRLLVDSYHWGVEHDSAGDIASNASLLAHVHVGTVAHRLVPGAEDCPEFAVFFGALKKGGYRGRVSIEAASANPRVELPAAIRLLKALGA